MRESVDDAVGGAARRTPRTVLQSCSYRMPFGPEPVARHLPSSGYRFRLWAPDKNEVELCLIDEDDCRHYVPCARAGGWHSCIVRRARPGDQYLFRIDHALEVPDPASRFNPQGVAGPSEIVDAERFLWDATWHGRPWEEAVIYELHVGTFTPEGTFAAATSRLDGLAALGVTAIELMPIAEFPGARGWGYDGVLPFAPKAGYGPPDELKRFIQTAHRRGLMVLLDVVYNHLGPEGNHLPAYAPQFFSVRYDTPWGPAIDFEDSPGGTVREFFIHNALYWLHEYRFDGLRLDAAHSIFDASTPDFLTELSSRIRSAITDRPVHLVLENASNAASRLGPPGTAGRFEAQWNDDFHHAAHVLLTGERDGYYADYGGQPVQQLVRCLSEGFAFQGERSGFHGMERGEASTGLPACAFVNFLQNHDQVGNRPFGDRLATLVDPQRLRPLIAIQLLAPSPPLIFMGEEAHASTPFAYFCDYRGELAEAVRAGRHREFAEFLRSCATPPGELPDPCDEATFLASKLDWEAYCGIDGQSWQDFYRSLLARRRRFVVPCIALVVPGRCTTRFACAHTFEVRWVCVDGRALVLRANLDDSPSPLLSDPGAAPFAAVGPDFGRGRLGPWSVRAYVLGPGTGARR